MPPPSNIFKTVPFYSRMKLWVSQYKLEPTCNIMYKEPSASDTISYGLSGFWNEFKYLLYVNMDLVQLSTWLVVISYRINSLRVRCKGKDTSTSGI